MDGNFPMRSQQFYDFITVTFAVYVATDKFSIFARTVLGSFPRRLPLFFTRKSRPKTFAVFFIYSRLLQNCFKNAASYYTMNIISCGTFFTVYFQLSIRRRKQHRVCVSEIVIKNRKEIHILRRKKRE